MPADADASTWELELPTSGTLQLDLEAQWGRIEVLADSDARLLTIEARDPGADLRFVSLNGSVELCFARDLRAAVHLSTAGDPIRSELAIRADTTELETRPLVLRPGDRVAARASEVRGSVGPPSEEPPDVRLRASTVRGEIALSVCEES
ncbi:MAG: hypothetical protein DWQ36_08925 [Acidobacteria bacterium]|nr:MAG: hypothetical protein DWQ30_22170 [Acidobacteriota bacterium]REK08484.1 MAG: hypothetical protein DWQ36_08925 [Acidobacteriota bacterium]